MRLISCFILLLSFSLQAKPVAYYFGNDVEFDSSITSPKQAFGYEVGQWHLRHDQIVHYLQTLAKESPRLSIETIATAIKSDHYYY